jgi:hypothetical protein
MEEVKLSALRTGRLYPGYSFPLGAESIQSHSAVGNIKGNVHPCAGAEALYRPYGP